MRVIVRTIWIQTILCIEFSNNFVTDPCLYESGYICLTYNQTFQIIVLELLTVESRETLTFELISNYFQLLLFFSAKIFPGFCRVAWVYTKVASMHDTFEES